jgi:hypothetical protein
MAGRVAKNGPGQQMEELVGKIEIASPTNIPCVQQNSGSRSLTDEVGFGL